MRSIWTEPPRQLWIAGNVMPGFEIDGGKLVSFRRARGWTQLELAVIAGVSERTVRNAERGRPLWRDFLAFLAGALAVEPVELVAKPDVLRPALRWQRQSERILAALHRVHSESDPKLLLDVALAEITVTQTGSGHLFPCDGDFSGTDGLKRYLDLVTEWSSALVDREMQLEIRGSGDLLVLDGVDHFTRPDSGARYRVRALHVYELEGERIRRADCWGHVCEVI